GAGEGGGASPRAAGERGGGPRRTGGGVGGRGGGDPAAAAVASRSCQDGVRTCVKNSASTAGTSSCRDAVAGSARDVNEPPCPAATPVSDTCAITTATPAHAERKSARPASKKIANMSGARTVGPFLPTAIGSTPPSRATSARNPCQRGNA